MGALISVIVPVFNTGQYLARCVDSLLAQDYPEMEIILVDDGSTDVQTGILCDKLAEENADVFAYHIGNGGSATARNYGISKAKGQYIGFVDSDDVVERDMYSTLYTNLKQHQVSVSIGELATEENGKLIDTVKPLPSGVYDNKSLLHNLFLGHWHSACTNLYERKLFDSVKFPDNEANEDYLLNYLIFKEQPAVYYTNRVLYHYIKHPGSNTSSPITLRFLDWLKHTERVLADYGGNGALKQEAFYQYLHSNVVLGNKSLLTLAVQPSEDAEQIYKVAAGNLKRVFKQLISNKYLSARYRLFAFLLAVCPRTYRAATLFILKLKGC